MHRKSCLTIGVVGLGLILLGLLSLALQPELPKPTGPFPVGRTTRIWVDTSRPEGLAEPSTAQPEANFRNVPVVIWYPAQGHSQAKSAYFPNLRRVAEDLAASGEVHPLEVLGLRWIQSYTLPEAPVASQAAPFPVILFSPGNGTNVEFYAALAEELASHGYVVVGINHPFDVAATVLASGRTARFNPGPFVLQEREAWVTERVNVRTADLLFALQELEVLSAEAGGLFASRIDTSRVAAAGHSLGGIAAAEACRLSSRILSCANLDGIQRGGPFSTQENPTPPHQPFMLITKEPKLPPNTIALFEGIPSGSYRVVIHGAKHESFTDGPLLMPSLLPSPNAADRHTQFIRRYLLAFFEQTLQQRASQELETSFQSPEVSLEVYGGLHQAYLHS